MEFELPNGDRLALPDGATGADAAAAIGPGLARAALAVKVDGVTLDLADHTRMAQEYYSGQKDGQFQERALAALRREEAAVQRARPMGGRTFAAAASGLLLSRISNAGLDLPEPEPTTLAQPRWLLGQRMDQLAEFFFRQGHGLILGRRRSLAK